MIPPPNSQIPSVKTLITYAASRPVAKSPSINDVAATLKFWNTQLNIALMKAITNPNRIAFICFASYSTLYLGILLSIDFSFSSEAASANHFLNLCSHFFSKYSVTFRCQVHPVFLARLNKFRSILLIRKINLSKKLLKRKNHLLHLSLTLLVENMMT